MHAPQLDRENNEQAKDKFVVIYDTYCGWCYAAAPVFDAIIDTGAEVEVLHRHLFDGVSAPRMSEGKGAQILQTIPHIETLTGQIFSDSFKTNIAQSESEVLKSGLSAQAAALIHDLGPKKEFALRRRLENLHFRQGVSSNDRQAIVGALIAEGVAPEQAEQIGTPALQAKAARQTEKAKSLMAAVGSRGVPTVLKVRGNQLTQIDHQAFYGRPEAVADSVGNTAKN